MRRALNILDNTGTFLRYGLPVGFLILAYMMEHSTYALGMAH